MENNFEHSKVPLASRKGIISMLAIMLGFTFFSASMQTGAELGFNLDFKQLIYSILLGNLILGLYTGLLAYIGAKTGFSTHLLGQYSFGKLGSKLPSFLLAFTQIGWFGVGVAMFALPVGKLLNINVYIVVLLAGLLMTSTAYFGVRALIILSAVAVPLITFLGGFSLTQAVNDAGGFKMFTEISGTGELSFDVAIGLVVGTFISGGTLTADFTRFAKTAKIAVMATVVAFFLGNSLMFSFGAVGAKVYGLNGIFEVMAYQGLIFLAILVLGLNIWTTNDNALYASSLAIAHVFSTKKSKAVIINGVIGTLLAIFLFNYFTTWLTFLSAALPPIGAIIITDYFLIKKRKYSKITTDKINKIAIVSWISGSIAAIFAVQLSFSIVPIISIGVTSIIYLILNKTKGEKNANNKL